MDNELSLTTMYNDATYLRQGAIQININPCYELQRKSDINQSATKGVKPTSIKEASSNTKFKAVLIIMIVIVLLTLASIALSVTTFS